jgi:hypothetical protein
MGTGSFGLQVFAGDRIEHDRSTLDGACLSLRQIPKERSDLCHAVSIAVD